MTDLRNINGYLTKCELRVNQENLDLKQKLDELQRTIDECKLDIERMLNENESLNEQLIDAKQTEAHLISLNQSLSEQVGRLQIENEEIKLEKEDSDKMRLDAKERHEVKVNALNQNLATLRGEAKQQSEKLAHAEALIMQLKSNQLELEIKLESVTEERNQLVERCINAERMHEHLKIQNIELKRKLEDTQYGLQELGREHQILQV